jgi:hypothetical protein
MLKFKDFVPFIEKREGIYAQNQMEGFESAVAEADAWMRKEGILPLHVETVVVPSLDVKDGTRSPRFGHPPATGSTFQWWFQFLRIWYQQNG